MEPNGRCQGQGADVEMRATSYVFSRPLLGTGRGCEGDTRTAPHDLRLPTAHGSACKHGGGVYATVAW
jgi:hypothetical protein